MICRLFFCVFLFQLLRQVESFQSTETHSFIVSGGYLVDGVYICRSGSNACYCSCGYELSSSFVFADGETQRRWFLSKSPTNGAITQPIKIYGSIEKSADPWILGPWKRLGQEGTSESFNKLTLLALPKACDNEDDSILVAMTLESIMQYSQSSAAVENYHIQMMTCSKILANRLKINQSNVIDSVDNAPIFSFESFVYCKWLGITQGQYQSKICIKSLRHSITKLSQQDVNISIPISPLGCVLISAFDKYEFDTTCLNHSATSFLATSSLYLALDFHSSYEVSSKHLYAYPSLQLSMDVGSIIFRGCHTLVSHFLGYPLIFTHTHTDSSFEVSTACSVITKLAKGAIAESIQRICSHHASSLPYLSNSSRKSWEENMMIMYTLISVGAIESSAMGIRRAVQELYPTLKSKYEPVSPEYFTQQLGLLADRSPTIRYVLTNINPLHKTERGSIKFVLRSPCVRAAILMKDTIKSTLSMLTVSGEDHAQIVNIFPALFGMLLQMTAPTVLSLPQTMWIYEVLILRSIAIESLDFFVDHCSTLHSYRNDYHDECFFHPDDSNLSNAARGIFLLAYQGTSLTLSSLHNHSDGFKFLDPYIPSKFSQLFRTYNSLHEVTSISFPLQASIPCYSQRPIRVGFLSSYFRLHSVGRLLSRLIVRLVEGNSNMEIFILLPSHPRSGKFDEPPDDISDSLLSLPLFYSHCQIMKLPMSSSHAAAQIIELYLDVLVFGDLHMDALTTSLARRRLASSQAAFWGHPFTSGSTTIDYFIASSYYFSLNDDEYIHQFSEQIVLFDTLNFLMFTPRSQTSSETSKDKSKNIVSRAQYLEWLFSIGRDVYGNQFKLPSEFSLSDLSNSTSDFRLFGCHQSIMKMHPLFDIAIEKILSLDSRSFVILSFSSRQIIWQNMLMQRLVMSQGNSSWLQRVIFVDQMSHDSYLRLVCGCDVTLDPFPFGGGVTLVDSLSCGLFPPQDSFATSIPFVTSPALQSVLHLGAGIDSYLLQTQMKPNMKSNKPQGLDDFYKHVNEYSNNAISLALRRRNKQVDLRDEYIWKRLYDNEDVVAEWNSFLIRIARGQCQDMQFEGDASTSFTPS